MRTVGEILKKARLERQLSLEQVSRVTRINIKYLKAIEANDFDSLPPAAFTKGFMQNYAKAVGLNAPNILAIFRRDYDQDERGRIVPREINAVNKPRLNLFNPTTTTVILSGILGLLVVGFFVRQIIAFREAPPLQIMQPTDGQTVVSPVTVVGSTKPEAGAAVNGRVVTVSREGVFTSQLTLSSGEQVIVVTVSSRGGKERSEQLRVVVE